MLGEPAITTKPSSPSRLIERIDAANQAGTLPELAGLLRREGHTISDVHSAMFTDYQTQLRAAGREAAVARLLAAGDTIDIALGLTFDPALVARFDPCRQAGRLLALTRRLHDAEGWSRQQLYTAFLEYIFHLRAHGHTEDEEEVVCEILDRLSGWCSSTSLLWPDEPLEP